MNASAREEVVAGRVRDGISAAAPRLPRIGPASPTRASATAFSPSDLAQIDGAQERDEHRRRGLDPLAAELDHVAHLVHEQQQHEADRELPAPDQRVGGDRDQHGRRRGEDLDLRQQEQKRLELRAELERAAGRGAQRGPMLAPVEASPGAGMDRALGRAWPALRGAGDSGGGCSIRDSMLSDYRLFTSFGEVWR